MLKFTHGVEVGAMMAYLGHYRRCGEEEVLAIALEELGHQKEIVEILSAYNCKPSIWFDIPFYVVGSIIGCLCLISPLILLDKVAEVLELFAVFSYDSLAEKFPQYRDKLLTMSDTEQRHQEYFRRGKDEL